MTPAQLQTLRSHIDASPDLISLPNAPDGAFAAAELLNLAAAPAHIVWVAIVDIISIMTNGFDWVRVDNLSVGKARIWEWMTGAGSINPSQANVRSGILACWSAAGDLAMRQAIFNHCVRSCSRVEKLYASGTGAAPNDQGVGPATLSYEGPVSYQDVLAARAL